MDVLYARCSGIDIHKKSITVCVLIREAGRKEEKQIREFGTTTAAILSCGDWLRDLGVTHVGHGIHGGLLATGLEPVGRTV
jgi:hypothetical protein